jgi:hypothetical protein
MIASWLEMRFLLRSTASAAVALFALAAAGVSAPAGCAHRTACQFNSDCIDEYCDNGTCKHDCVVSSLDCPSGQVCNAIGKCGIDDGSGGGSTGTGGGATGTGGAGGATTGTGGAAHAGGAPTTTTSSTTSSTSSTTSAGGQGQGGGGPAKLHELDACQNDVDCAAPLLCKPMVVAGTKRCTRPCNSNGDCISGTRCLVLGGAKACVADDVGRPCNVPSACNFACFVPGPQYCTVPCATGADCPNGYGCMPVSGQRVCIKAEADADQCQGANKKCIVPAACDDTILVTSCTLACDTPADCPERAAGLPPWTCDGLCRRPQGVVGPLPEGAPAEYACLNGQVVNLCNDGQHIDFANFTQPSPPALNCPVNVSVQGSPGDSCVDSCRYQGGCPYGYACRAAASLDNGASAVGLCMPTGFGEVGAACAKDGDCAFGWCAKGKCSRDCTADGVCPTGSTCVPTGNPPVEGLTGKRCE